MRFLTCEPTSMWSLQLKNPWLLRKKSILFQKIHMFFTGKTSRGATQPLDTWPGPACTDGVRCTAPPLSAAPAADRPGRPGPGGGRGRGASGRGREAHRWGPWKSSDLAPACMGSWMGWMRVHGIFMGFSVSFLFDVYGNDGIKNDNDQHQCWMLIRWRLFHLAYGIVMC